MSPHHSMRVQRKPIRRIISRRQYLDRIVFWKILYFAFTVDVDTLYSVEPTTEYRASTERKKKLLKLYLSWSKVTHGEKDEWILITVNMIFGHCLGSTNSHTHSISPSSLQRDPLPWFSHKIILYWTYCPIVFTMVSFFSLCFDDLKPIWYEKPTQPNLKFTTKSYYSVIACLAYR